MVSGVEASRCHRHVRDVDDQLSGFSVIDLPPSASKVRDAALQAGLAIDIKVHEQSTRTAEEAAAACGCSVGQIVKSLIFRGARSQHPVLLLVSGVNRVDEKAVARYIGEKLDRPDAGYVREVTGFAIGGIPPLGHATALTTYMDEDLLHYAEVWAAAGTPTAVFRVDPAKLREATEATVIAVR
jgi:prolyl-tRNA editing enzyme YbaK/EbsC (Cys-tRNA(Pro) deacylase)